MKTSNDKISFWRVGLTLLLFLFHPDIDAQTNSNSRPTEIKPFVVSIRNSHYAEAYSVLILLTDKNLKIIYQSDLVGAKDTVIFSKDLKPTDTLLQISKINLDKLKEYYSNPCIDDGSQVTVTIKKDSKIKAIHLSNYYQDDIGKIIYLINSLVVDNYKVWYNKEKLIADYKRCK